MLLDSVFSIRQTNLRTGKGTSTMIKRELKSKEREVAGQRGRLDEFKPGWIFPRVLGENCRCDHREVTVNSKESQRMKGLQWYVPPKKKSQVSKSWQRCLTKSHTILLERGLAEAVTPSLLLLQPTQVHYQHDRRRQCDSLRGFPLGTQDGLQCIHDYDLELSILLPFFLGLNDTPFFFFINSIFS